MVKTVDVYRNVTSMLPLGDIQDPAVRDAMQALQTMLSQRSGDTNPKDPSKWLTRADVEAETLNTMARVFGAGAIGVTGNDSGWVGKAIDDLANYFKESLAYKILGEKFAYIDISALQRRIEETLGKVSQLQDRAFKAVENEQKRREEQDAHITDTTQRLLNALGADLGSRIVSESETRASAIEVSTRQLNAAISKLDEDTQAAIISEATTRASAIEAATSQINIALSELDKDTKALIFNESTTRATAVETVTKQFNAAIAQLDSDTSASIRDESTARASADEVITNQYKVAVAQLDTDTKALITSEATARAAADEVTTKKINADLAQLSNDTKALITEEATTRAAQDEASTNAFNAQIAQLSKEQKASIVSESETRANNDASITQQFNAALSEFDTDNKALISSEASTRATAVQAATEEFRASVAQLRTDSQAAVTGETNTRVSQDTALARAINTIWANIGGSSAVIQDGALAESGQNVSQATKWNQVQAAVTDPNTGEISTTAIRQELNSYANRNDNTLNSIYSVRAQVTTDGRTVMGGIAVAATNGAGSSQGPTIDVGVRADKFFIAATADTPDGNTQLATDNSMPFMVLTRYENVYGRLYAPGVYIKRAVIGEATVGTAQIEDAAITYAKIKFADIDTLHIRGNAVTVPLAAYTPDKIAVGQSWTTVQSLSVPSDMGRTILNFAATYEFNNNNSGYELLFRVVKAGIEVVAPIPAYVNNTSNGNSTFNFSRMDTSYAAGLYEIQFVNNRNGGVAYIGHRSISSITVRR